MGRPNQAKLLSFKPSLFQMIKNVNSCAIVMSSIMWGVSYCDVNPSDCSGLVWFPMTYNGVANQVE